MAEEKQVWVKSLPGRTFHDSVEYKPSQEPVQVPESLAKRLGLDSFEAPDSDTPLPSSLPLDAQHKALQNEHDRLTRSHTRLQAELKDTQDNLESATGRVHELLSERDTLMSQLADAHTEHARLTEQVSGLQAQVQAAPAGTTLPEGFPGRSQLVAAGLSTVEAVRFVTPEQLSGISGIGESTITKITDALKG